VWFHQRVTWEAHGGALPWKTTAVNPNGKERYRLTLVPLWALEGGIVAIEIRLALPAHPDRNLFGERLMHQSQPFVITVEELRAGIENSQFGANRVLHAGHVILRVKIQSASLGKGAGGCETCDNIQKLVAEISLRSK
jgi:hypothetical protein